MTKTVSRILAWIPYIPKVQAVTPPGSPAGQERGMGELRAASNGRTKELILEVQDGGIGRKRAQTDVIDKNITVLIPLEGRTGSSLQL
jgi:hypothetical protein